MVEIPCTFASFRYLTYAALQPKPLQFAVDAQSYSCTIEQQPDHFSRSSHIDLSLLTYTSIWKSRSLSWLISPISSNVLYLDPIHQPIYFHRLPLTRAITEQSEMASHNYCILHELLHTINQSFPISTSFES